MKWPNDPPLPPKVLEKINLRIERFLAEDTSSNGASDSLAVENLILDIFSIAGSHSGTNNAGGRQMNLILLGMEWDTDTPRLAHAQKYINRLFSGDPGKAYEYIDKAINERLQEDSSVAKNAMGQAGSLGGTAKNQHTKIVIDKAMEHYEKNKSQFISKKAAAQALEKEFPPVKFSTYYRILRTKAR